MRLASARYLLSVHDPKQLPPDGAPEVAFAGRSNAGKSSALNTLASQKRLAYVSKTPGRTQLINFFAVGEDALLVDLPGYGYAGVPLAVRQHWEELVGSYVGTRLALAGVIIVMDARHPLTPLDYELLEWLAPAARPVHVLLTKSDKLSKQVAQRTLGEVRRTLASLYPDASASLFSSLKRTGIEEATNVIARWTGGATTNKKPRPKGSKAGAKKP
jgi:GTP-binding protein